MNNKKISTQTIITCLTMLIASNLIAMDESRKRSHEDSNDNIEESRPLKRQALEIECVICREPVEELAPQQHTHQERGMRLGCIQGENNHYFHTGCLNSWLTRTNKSQSQCPSCKQYLIVPPINFQAIFAAINNNTIDNLQTLIERATINVRDEDSDMTALDYAALKGNDTIVDFLLTNGGNPNLQNSLGLTALHVAAEKEHLAIVELLLTHSANTDVKNNLGLTALHYAAFKGHQPIVELLLTHGANPNLQDNAGNTALHYAAVQGHQPMVERLLTHGANTDLQDKKGLAALHYAAFKGHRAIVELLLTHHANPNLQNSLGSTALHVAAKKGYRAIVQLLLTQGVNPNLKDMHGDTALHVAAKKGYQRSVEFLLTHGANQNLHNTKGLTALHVAAEKGHRAIVELLLKNGANLSLKDNNGRNALQIATEINNQDIIDAINTHQSFRIYAELQKQFPSATIIQENNTLTVNNITATFSFNTDNYNPFTDDNYHTIDIMVGDNTEPLQTYLTQTLGATTHRLGLLGTCWHLDTSSWQLTYRDASSWYSNYSSHSHIKPNTPLRFYLSAPDDADFKTYINFCVGLVAATAGLTHE